MTTFKAEPFAYRVIDKECPRSDVCPTTYSSYRDGTWVSWDNLEYNMVDAASCAQCGEPLEVEEFPRCQAVLEYQGTYQCIEIDKHQGPHNAAWAEGNEFKEDQEGWVSK